MMRFYQKQHPFYCGIDLLAKTMYVCIVNQAGEILVHRDIKTRADGSGDFSLVVPDRGKYHLLIISNHAVRPGGTELPEADLLEMQPYFSTARLLIGPYQYSWTLREINDHIRIDHSFARAGQ
ncbi:MAG: hypothetical protein ACYSWU_07480 [Planctomycetota bacterium]|jgi:hypothetical protein